MKCFHTIERCSENSEIYWINIRILLQYSVSFSRIKFPSSRMLHRLVSYRKQPVGHLWAYRINWGPPYSDHIYIIYSTGRRPSRIQLADTLCLLREFSFLFGCNFFINKTQTWPSPVSSPRHVGKCGWLSSFWAEHLSPVQGKPTPSVFVQGLMDWS